MTIFTKGLCHASVALAIACCGGSAHAIGATSTVQVTGISYELIDLAPDDGITPYLTLASESFGARTAYSDADWTVIVPSNEVGHSGSTSLTRPYGSASTWWNGSQQFGTASVSDNGLVSRGIAGINTYNVEFTLSPWTRLSITVNGTLTAELDGSSTRAQTTVALDGGVTRGENDSWTNRFVNRYHNLERGSEAIDLTAILDSDATAGTVSLRLESFATASIYGQPAPVPEPASYAMLLAGLGLVGVVSRQRCRVRAS